MSGDSHSLFRLVRDIRAGRDITGLHGGPALANRELARVLERGEPALAPAPRGSVFAWDGPWTGEVRFLPRERLLSAPERAAALRAFTGVLDTGAFTSGPAVGAFEAALAEFLGVPHAVATSSGTDALIIALRAVGVGHGDNVILPANSFAATENAVLACGARPVLADVGDDYTLDPDSVAERITGRTKAVLPVHLHGKLTDLSGLRAVCDRHGAALVEDACQAIGVTGVGQHADAAALSFNPYKNFGLCGKAGAVVTRVPELAERSRAVSYHGFSPDVKNVKSELLGFNAGIDNTQAEIALGLLPYLTLGNYRRLFLAARYLDGLADLAASGAIRLPEFTPDHAWHLFPVQVEPAAGPRDALKDRLWAEHRVETDVYYPVLTHRQHPVSDAGLSPSRPLFHTERLHSRVLHLPLHKALSIAEQNRTIEALHDCVRSR
ncbi:DegT/DnrJ/EryC1/StrS family aminotransferase [Streptomyces prasinopilosus]|uniref:DegT/DnrJ/EryC1/StrS family aminotransferase n=1 Tax=Streptomyces prasinopilosus TaxID=67344 RepID=UPI0006E34576|nr:DegT/DnrJ/EryC1/StrS family aminotransferase [Streptomyces prasinopilosus]